MCGTPHGLQRRRAAPAAAGRVQEGYNGANYVMPVSNGTAGECMSDLFDNPMGTDGFEFVEYTAPDPQLLRTLFERLGFATRRQLVVTWRRLK